MKKVNCRIKKDNKCGTQSTTSVDNKVYIKTDKCI